MPSTFLGHYLLKHGLISVDQLLAAITLVETRNLRFGDIAVAMGLLTPGARDEVLERQQQADETAFGQLAVSLGHLEAGDVETVLAEQKRRNLRIGDAIVELGFVPRELLERVAEEFQTRRQRVLTSDTRSIPDPDLRIFVGMLRRLAGRLAHLELHLGDTPAEGRALHARMHTHARGWSEWHLMADVDTVLQLTGALTRGSYEDEEMVHDAFSEFLSMAVAKATSSTWTGRRVTLGRPHLSEEPIPSDATIASLISPCGWLRAGHARRARVPEEGRSRETKRLPAPLDLRPDPSITTALIVDDSRAMRRSLEACLRSLGIQRIEHASSRREAIHKAEAMRPNLVTLDVDIAGDSGLEALDGILAVSPMTHVVMVTALEGEYEVSEALRRGASGYCGKPVDEDRLHECLRRLRVLD